MKRKIVTLLLGAALAFASFMSFACNTKTNGGGSDSPDVLDIYGQIQGYDMKWLEPVAEAFKAEPWVKTKYPKLEVDISTNTVVGYAENQFTAGTKIDLAFTELAFRLYGKEYGRSPVLEDLSDLYEKTVPGEEITLGEKMLPGYQESMKYIDTRGRTQYPSLPYVSGMITIYYNADKLAAAGIEVPLTTDQLDAACAHFKTQDGYAIMGPTLNGSYWGYLYPLWWTQYEGYEAYGKFHEGKLKNNQDEWVLGTTGSDVMDSQPGRKLALEVAEQLLSIDKGNYLTEYAPALDFMPAQDQFMTGSGAFYAMGDWFDSEMRALRKQRLDKGEVLPVVRGMRVPIISAIIDKTPSITTDAKLAEVIKSIDLNKKTPADLNAAKQPGDPDVTQTDYDYIREARRVNYALGTRSASIIPAYSPAKELAKDFLLFMATDKANALFTEATLGTPLPYKFDIAAKAPALYASLNPSAKMVNEFFSNPDPLFAAKTIVDEAAYPLYMYAGHNAFRGLSHRRLEYFFTEEPPYTVTGSRGIYDITVASWNSTSWNTALKNAMII